MSTFFRLFLKNIDIFYPASYFTQKTVILKKNVFSRMPKYYLMDN